MVAQGCRRHPGASGLTRVPGTDAPPGALAVAVIVVIFTIEDDGLKALLVRRSAPPEEGTWALPGGLLATTAEPEVAATRKLLEETGVSDVFLEQLYTFSGLDATRRAVAVSYFALVQHDSVRMRASEEWQPDWVALDDPAPLAFNNEQVLGYARERLRAKLEYSNVAYSLLPQRFTLSRLQRVYEAIGGRPLDKRNFRRRMLSLGILQPTGLRAREGAHRPAQLYEFTSRVPTVF